MESMQDITDIRCTELPKPIRYLSYLLLNCSALWTGKEPMEITFRCLIPMGIFMGLAIDYWQYRITCYSVFKMPSRPIKKAENALDFAFLTLTEGIDNFLRSKLCSIAIIAFSSTHSSSAGEIRQ